MTADRNQETPHFSIGPSLTSDPVFKDKNKRLAPTIQDVEHKTHEAHEKAEPVAMEEPSRTCFTSLSSPFWGIGVWRCATASHLEGLLLHPHLHSITRLDPFEGEDPTALIVKGRGEVLE